LLISDEAPSVVRVRQALEKVFEHPVPRSIIVRWTPSQRRQAHDFAQRAQRYNEGLEGIPPLKPAFLYHWR
jgi:hypothetical protein